MKKINQELVYALALQQVKGIGVVTAKKLIVKYQSAIQLHEAYELHNNVVFENISQRLFEKKHLDAALQELTIAEEMGVLPLYFLDDNYPTALLSCADAPIVLFYDGSTNLNSFDRCISIVGTRNVTEYGLRFCAELMADLQIYQPLIVSGFAIGVDIHAHLQALKHNLPTLAVLAHGYQTIYPAQHKKFYRTIRESAGFLTEFRYGDPPLREHFLQRNRIVAGISQATLVIESGLKGGAMVTADIAHSYDREVFALPGNCFHHYSKGCNELIKINKAAVITSATDLVAALGWDQKSIVKSTPAVVQPKLFADLTAEQKQISDLLAQEAMYMDEIARALVVPIYKISSLLFELEMKGVVKVMPGKLVQRC